MINAKIAELVKLLGTVQHSWDPNSLYEKLINLQVPGEDHFELDFCDDDGGVGENYPHSTWPSSHLENAYGRTTLTIRLSDVDYVILDNFNEVIADCVLATIKNHK